MALIESLGYKQEKYVSFHSNGSPQYHHSNSASQRRKSGNEWMTNDFSMTPYGTNNNKQQGFAFNSSMNKENLGSGQTHRSQSLLGSADQTFGGGHSNMFNNESKQQQNNQSSKLDKAKSKYSSLPRKSMLSSGIGFVSPIPQKYASQGAITKNNKLDLSKNESMPISPIKSNNHQLIVADNTMHLNSTQNTLNFSSMNGHNHHTNGYAQNGANESRLSVNGNGQKNILHPNQVTIIGFAPGEASFIHRKFRSYGSVINSEWSKNALFLEYERSESAVRALAENAKWINNGHLTYMIAVMYAELTDLNPNSNDNVTREDQGRFLNLSEMYRNSYNNTQNSSYFGQNHNNVEKPPAIQSGPTHIFWKIFNFIVNGW